MSDYNEMAKTLQDKIKHDEFLIERRVGDGDRRKAFFTFIEPKKDRRVQPRRNREIYCY